MLQYQLDDLAAVGSRSRKAERWLVFVLALVTATASIGAAPPVTFTDLATPFARAAISSRGQPVAVRIAAVRRELDPVLPGVYPANADTDRRIAKALAEFPAREAGFDYVLHVFPATLQDAVARFRNVFPEFVSPLPIYLYHSLGRRDGGSEYLEPGHRHIMFFGADMIAQFHADESLAPFFDHELFHLEHARFFPDCDQLWCALWQEGLAVDAAATMTPGATDHQLLIDIPTPIRAPTDGHWTEALCFAAIHFDDTREDVTAQALQGGGKPPSGLPDRFGYYLGYRLTAATGQAVSALDRLDHQAARRLLRTTLNRAMVKAKATCAPPKVRAPITHVAPHAV